MEKFGASFLTAQGPTTDVAYLKEIKIVALYFGAKYCTPCRPFTQKLIEFYNEINHEEKVFEVIYFGFDQTQGDFNETIQGMPWLSYEFRDEKKLKFYYEFREQIAGIPALLVLDPQNLKLLTKSGRGHVELENASEVFEKWQEFKVVGK